MPDTAGDHQFHGVATMKIGLHAPASIRQYRFYCHVSSSLDSLRRLIAPSSGNDLFGPISPGALFVLSLRGHALALFPYLQNFAHHRSTPSWKLGRSRMASAQALTRGKRSNGKSTPISVKCNGTHAMSASENRSPTSHSCRSSSLSTLPKRSRSRRSAASIFSCGRPLPLVAAL